MAMKEIRLSETLTTKKEVLKLVKDSRNILVVNAERLMDEIMGLQEVDAVQVVRCKDCKFCETNETWSCIKKKDETTWWCENPCFDTGDPYDCVIIKDHENGCMKGERKDGETDENRKQE